MLLDTVLAPIVMMAALAAVLVVAVLAATMMVGAVLVMAAVALVLAVWSRGPWRCWWPWWLLRQWWWLLPWQWWLPRWWWRPYSAAVVLVAAVVVSVLAISVMNATWVWEFCFCAADVASVVGPGRLSGRALVGGNSGMRGSAQAYAHGMQSRNK